MCEQLTLFDRCDGQPMEQSQDSLSGRTCRAPLAAIIGATFKPCLRKSEKPRFQCLDLADGQTRGWCELLPATSHGASWTLNIGEFPRDASASSLSQILQKREDVPQKYFLSPRACQGILRRAKDRGKELPPELKAALTHQASIRGMLKADASNQQTELPQPSQDAQEVDRMPSTSMSVTAVAENSRGELRTTGDVHPCLATGGGKPGEGYPCIMNKVYVSGGYAAFDEKSVAGSVRASGGDRGGGSENLAITKD